jgi:hypothetical protein
VRLRGNRVRVKDLAAALQSLEGTLIARANLLGTHEGEGRVHLLEAVNAACEVHGTDRVTQAVLADAIGTVLAVEFRKIAEEMHFH